MDNESRKILVIAAVLGALAVISGAFGAHGLQPLLIEHKKLTTYETAVEYHFYHVVALLVLGVVKNQVKLTNCGLCFWFFFTGILLFSGSLYALSLTNITILGAITPIGGVLLILGWITLGIAIKKS